MSFSENLAEIEARISKACQKAERETAPDLVAVSKRQPDERIEAALAAGVRVFGENRVQEAQERWEGAQELAGHSGLLYPQWRQRWVKLIFEYEPWQ